MHKLYKGILILILVPVSFSAGYPDENANKIILTHSKIIEIIDSYDPEVFAAKFRAKGASQAIRKEKSNYYPTLAAQAHLEPPYSFPGSGAGTGVLGVTGSPYHAGQGYGLTSAWTIYDFGRTGNAVKAAEYDERTKKYDILISRIIVLQTVFQIYFEEIFNISVIKILEDEINKLQFLEKEIVAFVSTGQRSIVDSYLIRSEMEKVRTELASYRQIENQTRKRLALFLLLPVDNIVVPDWDQLPVQTEIASLDPEKNPFLKKVNEELNYARAKVAYAKSKNLPEIKAVSSAGYYDGVRSIDVLNRTIPLVKKSNWSVVVGVNMPIFEGFRIDSEIKESEAIASSKAEDIKATQRRVQEDNFKFDERIESSRTQLKHLDEELKISQAGYQIAFKRYNQFQGTLLDLKETITNLYRVKNALIRAELIFNLNLFLKKIYNGYL